MSMSCADGPWMEKVQHLHLVSQLLDFKMEKDQRWQDKECWECPRQPQEQEQPPKLAPSWSILTRPSSISQPEEARTKNYRKRTDICADNMMSLNRRYLDVLGQSIS